MTIILSSWGVLQLAGCCGLALRECARASAADRLVLGGLATLGALLAWGAATGLWQAVEG